MSNEDRIKDWRARRKARDTSVGQEQAVDRDTVEDKVNTDQSRPVSDVLAMVLDSLASAPRGTIADRRRVYGQLELEQKHLFVRTGVTAEVAELQRRRLRMVIRTLENDIRARVDVFMPGYAPAMLLGSDARLQEGFGRRQLRRRQDELREARRRAARENVEFKIDMSSEEAVEVEDLRTRLARMHARQVCATPGTIQSRLSVLLPLLKIQLQMIQGESRIALLWALVGPAVLLSIISSFYFLSGMHYILGMDVPTFSMLGATTWIMFRQIIFRSSTGYVSMRGLINLEPVTPLAVALVQGFIFLILYAGVYAILISFGHWLGLISLPANTPGFLLWVLLMGAGGAAIGVIFGSIATWWHFFLRFSTVIERFLQAFSAVFFVSEQLPVQYREYFLWSPFAHGMQLLRSSYFSNYESRDASVAYFSTALVFLAVVALIVERMARRSVQPM